MKIKTLIPTIEKPMLTKLIITASVSAVITLITAAVYSCLKVAKESDETIDKFTKNKK